MKHLFQVIRTLIRHPLGRLNKTATLWRYFKWQVISRLFASSSVKPWVGGTSLLISRGFHASTACHYYGLPEFESMSFLLHLLRPGDLFVDAGANIGAYSILASGVCRANSLAFEPCPPTALLLEENVSLNKLGHLVEINKTGLGAESKDTHLTIQKGIQNHVSNTALPNESIPVQIRPLDDFCKDRPPVLLKIDVEGYETAVLKGAKKTLHHQEVKAIIMESMGLGERFGFDEEALHHDLLNLGFVCYAYHPFERKLSQLQTPAFGNNLYLRDINFINFRLQKAAAHDICGNQL